MSRDGGAAASRSCPAIAAPTLRPGSGTTPRAATSRSLSGVVSRLAPLSSPDLGRRRGEGAPSRQARYSSRASSWSWASFSRSRARHAAAAPAPPARAVTDGRG
eukprot:5476850-Prymnesium_polylepis.1